MSLAYTNASDENLIKAVKKGEIQAFGELYERYFDEISRYIIFRIDEQAEAEDLLQTVFIKAWEVICKNQPDNYNFRALLYKIAHNLIIDRWRTQKKYISLDKTELLSDSKDLPEQVILSDEENKKLRDSIQALEPKLQQVFICRFINGLSHAETAQILGLTVGHVRVLQHRALKIIRIKK